MKRRRSSSAAASSRMVKRIAKRWNWKVGPQIRKIGRMSRSRRSFKKAVNQHIYTRYATTPTDFDVTTGSATRAEKFTFDSIKGYTEFTALYDRYKITCVQMELTLITNPNSANPLNINAAGATTYYNNPTNWYPKLWYVRDYDDESTATIDALKERANVKCIILRPNKVYKIKIRPAVLLQTYRTVSTTGYAPKWKNWIDMVDVDVPHYGIKYDVDCQGLDPNDSYPFKIRVEYKYFFTCKDVL